MEKYTIKSLVIFTALLFAVQGAAQVATPAMPAKTRAPLTPSVEPVVALRTVDQVLTKNIRAIGGREAILKVTSRRIKGNLKMGGTNLTARWELVAKAPNKRATAWQVPGASPVRDGFNGRIAWSLSPTKGPSEKKGEELARQTREAEFYRDLKFKELYPKMVLLGVQRMGNEEAYVIEGTPRNGQPERLYFDANNGLLIHHEFTYTNETGKVSVAIHYQDFRTVDGLKLPFLIQFHITAPNTPEANLTVQCTEIKNNVPLPDNLFEKPSK